jgi:hypothetical protein
MKAATLWYYPLLFCFCFTLGSCKPKEHMASNPYIHAKTKPSEEIKEGFAKKEHWWHNKKNKNWFFFEKKN